MTLFAGSGNAPDGGLQAIGKYMEQSVPEAERDRAGEVLLRILNGVLYEMAQLTRGPGPAARAGGST